MGALAAQWLSFAARHGRLVLVAGLIAGLTLPGLARLIKSWLPEMIVFLLFLSALRVGVYEAFGNLGELRISLAIIAVYQIALPLVALTIAALFDLTGATALAVILMCAAAPLSGSPNLTILTGHDPAPALRLLVVGTALLPLTVLPVLWALPQLGSISVVGHAASRLLLVIFGAAGLGFLLRQMWCREPAKEILNAIDGLSAVTMAVVVVALMSAVAPAIFSRLDIFWRTLATACVVNFGFQIVAYVIGGSLHNDTNRVPFAIVAGNRNIALFLAAFPTSLMDPLLLFIGCYQLPMYLTPLILARLYEMKQPMP